MEEGGVRAKGWNESGGEEENESNKSKERNGWRLAGGADVERAAGKKRGKRRADKKGRNEREGKEGEESESKRAE